MVQKLVDPEDLRLSPTALTRPEEAFSALLSWADSLSVWAGAVLGLRLEINAERADAGVLAEVSLLRDRRERSRIARRGLVDRRATFAALSSTNPVVRARVDEEGLALSFELPEGASLDRGNLRARVADPGALLELVTHLESLPEDVEVARRPAQGLSADEVRRLAEHPLTIAARVPAERVAAQDGHAEVVATALLHLYKIVAWADDNDGVRPSAKRRDKQAAKEHREASRARRKQEVRPERDAEDGATSTAQPPLDREGDAAAEPHPLRDLRSLRLVSRARVVDIDPSRPVEPGTHVIALGGPFEGKTGVVRELDGKGGARVLFGLLVATVDLKDLSAYARKRVERGAHDGGRERGGARPLLSSSHRRVPRGAS
ncbi:MAG: KOW motif-containing protein [Myxococcales bacterium]|jgi:hypothetical protein|nr:KOW motif-containing protein [Myxococcales bacterium]